MLQPHVLHCRYQISGLRLHYLCFCQKAYLKLLRNAERLAADAWSYGQLGWRDHSALALARKGVIVVHEVCITDEPTPDLFKHVAILQC